MHSLRSIIEATEKLKKKESGNFPGGGAFEQLFGPVRGDLRKNFLKIHMHGGLPGDVEASIWLVHYKTLRICPFKKEAG